MQNFKPVRPPKKISPFAQSLRQTQILILEILIVYLWLKFLSSLTLSKTEHFSKVPCILYDHEEKESI